MLQTWTVWFYWEDSMDNFYYMLVWDLTKNKAKCKLDLLRYPKVHFTGVNLHYNSMICYIDEATPNLFTGHYQRHFNTWWLNLFLILSMHIVLFYFYKQLCRVIFRSFIISAVVSLLKHSLPVDFKIPFLAFLISLVTFS